MKKISIQSLILLVTAVFAAPLLTAQGYYGPGIPYNIRRMSGQGTAQIEGGMHYVSDKDTPFDIKTTLFQIGANYEFPSQGAWRTGRIRATYTGGNMEVGSFETEYDYRLDVDGEYFVKGHISITGLAGYGPYSYADEEGDTFNYGIGFNYYDLQNSVKFGMTLENGSIDTIDGVRKYSGVEVNGMEQSDFSWLKWYLGRFDGENLIRTDICFPIHFEGQGAGGYAILLRYVNVNSHAVSAGAPPLLSYGPLISDWTEHEEWLLQLKFGIDRRQSDFSVCLAYGFYRTDEFEGSNDSVLMGLGVKYHF